MRLGNDEHVSNPLACSFLAECHLQDGRVYRLSGNLTTEFIELPMRDFEICRRVFVLYKMSFCGLSRLKERRVFAYMITLSWHAHR
jgi:hypothetical protein